MFQPTPPAFVPQEGPEPGENPLIVGSGEMAERIRSFDWASTGMGALRDWSPGLVSHINTMLTCPLPTAIFMGPEFRAIYNGFYSTILMEKHPDALGQPAPETWAEIWSTIGPQFELAFHHGESIQGNEVLLPVLRGGSVREAYWTYSICPLTVGSDRVGIITFGQEVTQSVLAMRELEESRERLQIALSVTGCIGMWDWHVQEDLVFADERFATAYGTDPDLVSRRGMPVAEFLKSIHPDDLGRVHEAIVASINTGGEFLQEYRLIQKDGTARWVEARGRCILGPDGTPLSFPGVTIDISRRKLAEAALASGLVGAIPETLRRTPDASWRDTLRAMLESVGGREAGQLGSAGFVDEDFLRATSEMITSDLNLSSMLSRSAGTSGAAGGANEVLPLEQKHLLYAVTLVLNDLVRSMLREEQEAHQMTRLIQ